MIWIDLECLMQTLYWLCQYLGYLIPVFIKGMKNLHHHLSFSSFCTSSEDFVCVCVGPLLVAWLVGCSKLHVTWFISMGWNEHDFGMKHGTPARNIHDGYQHAMIMANIRVLIHDQHRRLENHKQQPREMWVKTRNDKNILPPSLGRWTLQNSVVVVVLGMFTSSRHFEPKKTYVH